MAEISGSKDNSIDSQFCVIPGDLAVNLDDCDIGIASGNIFELGIDVEVYLSFKVVY